MSGTCGRSTSWLITRVLIVAGSFQIRDVTVKTIPETDRCSGIRVTLKTAGSSHFSARGHWDNSRSP
ncbi:hypothetical protein Q8A67_024175 [Cirrhinus molitorella]|uniref:Secreted protein n=1 Tax=Cirrhinus molitorella TaxID=172907 RepID=A0AA88PC31_9TELE|nr:hypothetical protein Q8A67_024175 [Cirrhinus molitorella]